MCRSRSGRRRGGIPRPSAPLATSSAASSIAFATSSSMTPSSALTRAATALIRASASMCRRSLRSPEIGKFSTARCVCARHLAVVGTRIVAHRVAFDAVVRIAHRAHSRATDAAARHRRLRSGYCALRPAPLPPPTRRHYADSVSFEPGADPRPRCAASRAWIRVRPATWCQTPTATASSTSFATR